ncbi:hypothetical protein ACIQTZ_09870 [Paenarthrobacter sp. NPDC090520]|uniref:hypothetical protein n=1 Tax=Paenarthrobacter sp. NPDC090520 TaxID=3364382 RepID=UPI00382440C0
MQRTVLHTVMPSGLRRRVPAVLAGMLLAAGAWVLPMDTAHAAPCVPATAGSCPSLAAPTEPTPTQPGLAPETGKTKPTPRPEPTRVRETQQPAPAPAAPAPAVQAPQPAVVAPVTVTPEVSSPPSAAPEASTTAAAPATASATSSASPSPSKSSNWDTPVDKGKGTQAAVLANASYNGPNLMGLFGILGGVLLVGLGGLAFALWSKNRLSSH